MKVSIAAYSSIGRVLVPLLLILAYASWGGAVYAKYQLTPRSYVVGRAEYLNDNGGLFTGITAYTEALKEVTATYDFQLASGFDMCWEYRRDMSNQPIFITITKAYTALTRTPPRWG